MNGERTIEPAFSAEPQSTRENPLLVLLGGDPSTVATVLMETLRWLPPNADSAHWVDQLLDDPRLEALPNVREEAVRTLLSFGHPWALLINPDDLESFRKNNPTDLRPGRIAVGAAVGVVGGLAVPWFNPEVVGALFSALSIVWAMSVAGRALLRMALTRTSLMVEIVIGLLMALVTLDVAEFGATIGILAAVVPVALAGLAGGWSEN